MEVRRRGQAARQAALLNMGTRIESRAGVSRPSGSKPASGDRPSWLTEIRPGSIVDFAYGKDPRSSWNFESSAVPTRQGGFTRGVHVCEDNVPVLEVHVRGTM